MVQTFTSFHYRIVIFAAIILALSHVPGAYAEPYGSGSYAACPYGQTCPAPSPTTQATPPPDNTIAIVGYTLNLKDGQVISSPSYTIIVKLMNAADTSLVDRVEYYADDSLIGTTTEADLGGSYRFVWDLSGRTDVRLKVIMFDKLGNQIPQQVSVRHASAATPSTSPATTNPADQPTGFTAQVARAAAVVQKAAENIAKAVQRVILLTPPAVAISFPYFLFILLLVIALIFIYQTQREIRQIKYLNQVLEQDKVLAEEKTTFIQLTSHYLRTPFTLIKNGLSLLSDSGKITPTLAQTLKAQCDNLGLQIETIIGKISNNASLQQIEASHEAAVFRTWLAPSFLLPIALVGLLAFFADVLFINIGGINVGVINLLAQALIFVGLAALLYVALRSRHTQTQNRLHADAARRSQIAIDQARNTLIRDTITLCTNAVGQLRQSLPQLHGLPHAGAVERGFAQLDSLISKFSYVVRLESGGSQIQMTQFPIGEVIGRIQKRYQADLTAKKLEFVAPVSLLNVFQNAALLEEVIGSLVDNAIKFSSPGGRIEIAYQNEGRGINLRVSDQGAGIPADKLPQLFKPFARAESALTFDHPGLGLSLYLDKLIMMYLGGNIQVDAAPDKGASIKLDFPIAPSAGARPPQAVPAPMAALRR